MSMMEPEDITNIPTTSSSVLPADLSTILSPLMRDVKENMQQEFDKFKILGIVCEESLRIFLSR